VDQCTALQSFYRGARRPLRCKIDSDSARGRGEVMGEVMAEPSSSEEEPPAQSSWLAMDVGDMGSPERRGRTSLRAPVSAMATHASLPAGGEATELTLVQYNKAFSPSDKNAATHLLLVYALLMHPLSQRH
jgi:hypothetical protein